MDKYNKMKVILLEKLEMEDFIMRKVVLYIGMSLDGFIAKENGAVDWLVGENPESTEDGGYSEFIDTIDTIIMGYKTYHQVVTELSPNEWPYEGKEVYVLTHRDDIYKEGIHFVDLDIETLSDTIKNKEGKNIWICGGASIVNQCVKNNLVDVYHITVIPCILGNGIRLFSDDNQEIRLKLTHTKHYNEMIEMVYEC